MSHLFGSLLTCEESKKKNCICLFLSEALISSFSNKNKHLCPISGLHLCEQWRTMRSSASAFINKQTDHSVVKLSLVLHGHLYQLVKLRKPMWVRLQKHWKGTSVLFNGVEGQRILDLCAVMWSEDDRHLKRWHSAGLVTTDAHDEEVKWTPGLWSVDPPLSANTRWSTEPPWIL